MIRTRLNLTNNLQERITDFLPDFQYISYYVDLDRYPGGYVTWHWHEELEFIYVYKETLEVHIQNKCVIIRPGEGAFINSNILHMFAPNNRAKSCITYSQVFHRLFLSGSYNSIYETKYLRPVIKCKKLDIVKFTPSNPVHKQILELLLRSYEVAEKETFGYELEIRSLLSQIWIMIAKAAKDIINSDTSKIDIDNERIKTMISFINKHYVNKIDLQEIAQSANISERECLRCFKKAIDMTPFEYLIHYRIQVAADMLQSSSESITAIGIACGFSTSSYFGKIFKEIMRCTPRKYRENKSLKKD